MKRAPFMEWLRQMLSPDPGKDGMVVGDVKLDPNLGDKLLARAQYFDAELDTLQKEITRLVYSKPRQSC